MISRRTIRHLTRSGFFILFVLAPPLDIFRLDLTLGHFIIFGHHWTTGLDALIRGEINATEALLRLFFRVFLPILSFIALGIWIAWRYGRLYCGWLCPHFSVVEIINHTMRRASGKPSLWEKHPLPEQDSDGSHYPRNPAYWLWTGCLALSMALLWGFTLLSYLLPPAMLYHNLWHGELTFNQSLFWGIASFLFMLDFLLARHLFCQYGCAIGLFQSLVWMANPKALWVQFDKTRGEACKSCTQACDHRCPMRLNPRKNKRHMFTCTQCTQCVEACEHVQKNQPSLLTWAPVKIHPKRK